MPSWGKQVAEHPDTSSDALMSLAAHADVEVRTAVADHPSTLLETALLLAQDVDADLRYAMAENHNIHADVLIILAEDDNPFVAHRAKKTLARIQALSMLVQQPPKLELLGVNPMTLWPKRKVTDHADHGELGNRVL
jgi:hypothetical protein